MHLLSVLSGLIPSAHAAVIEQIGTDGAGIGEMWAEILSIFPHTGYGSMGLSFLIAKITSLILRFIGGIAVLFVIYAGIRMMMTVGDEGAFEEAKKTLTYAAIGLVLVLGTDAIITYVLTVVEQAAGG